MSRIKTREKVKDTKVLDKFAVVGQRMKNAYIRSKRNGLALMDDRQATPSEYAEDKVQFAADELVHDTANVAVCGTKTAVRQGRQLFQPRRKTPDRIYVSRPVSMAANHTVKNAQRTIKTTKQVPKVQQAAQATARAASTAAQAARTSARTTAAGAKAVRSTVKALIASNNPLAVAAAASGLMAVLVIAVICTIGLLAVSCFGAFFSGEGSATGQTVSAAAREINRDFEVKMEEIKTANPHDVLELSGSRAAWPDVLAVYAVKATTDPDKPLEVATMDDNKKALLQEIFWAMNAMSSRTETTATTQTVETVDGAGNIVETTETVTKTALYITVTHKTTDEMADAYNFTADQRAQLAQLLAEENRSMWSSILYDIGVSG